MTSPSLIGACNDGEINSVCSELRLHITDRKTSIQFLIDSGSVLSILPAHKFANGHAKEELLAVFVADVATAIIEADFLSNYNLLIDLKGRRLIDSTTGLASDGKALEAQQVNISTVNPEEPFKDLLAQYIAITKPQVTTNNKSSHFAHRITTTSRPVAARFRKIFGEKTTAARSKIQDLLNRGTLRPSNSPWASPIHMVPKRMAHSKCVEIIGG
ncbi:uncharacterized protein LOC113373662 [Ctenocephalides felis]|uniref:uncharacterized protein LOC113373662 n=1 Tax=Ctenocephalides felis TaxID=7515 RepID=UPI000E6E44BB|nr:uncharacterized protein LOC113373662 [Ctenocephalides felis]